MTFSMIIVAAIVGFGIAQLRHDKVKRAILYAGLIILLLGGLRAFGVDNSDFDAVMDCILVCCVAALVIVGFKRAYRTLNKRL